MVSYRVIHHSNTFIDNIIGLIIIVAVDATMAAKPYGQWSGTPMADEAVEDFLYSAGWGTLSLARDGEPYSIPISFGYDGEDVYFAFIRADSPNTKFEYIEDGTSARLLVTRVTGPFDWRSVSVTGTVRAIHRREEMGGEALLAEIDDEPSRETERGRDWGVLLQTLDENAWFSPDFERAEVVSELQGWRLEPETIAGVELHENDR